MSVHLNRIALWTAPAIILAIYKLRIHEIVTGPLWWSFGQ